MHFNSTQEMIEFFRSKPVEPERLAEKKEEPKQEAPEEEKPGLRRGRK